MVLKAKPFFMTRDRIGFSHWETADMDFAETLWGDHAVARLTCASGVFRSRIRQDS